MTVLPKNTRRHLMVLLSYCTFFLVGCGQEPPKLLIMGGQAPAFTINDLQGQEVSLAQYDQRPVVLRFFLPDCKY